MAGEIFGRTKAGEAVTCYTIARGPLTVGIMDYGAAITRLDVPDRAGRRANVVLGFDAFAAYEAKSPHFGAVIGRYANRIAGGRFTLDGTTYRLPVNDGRNTLHGGPRGFDRHVWRVTSADAGHVALRRRSPDGEEGFPGNLDVEVVYALSGDDTLRIDTTAHTDRPTVLNLTNHSYFNLAGEGAGDVFDHVLAVPADLYVPTDAEQIPLGGLAPVAGTPFDFRTPTAIGARIRSGVDQIVFAKGYDHTFVPRGPAGTLRPAARLVDPSSGRRLDVATTQPGVQIYAGCNLDGTLVGPSGRTYRSGDAVCFETQGFPDAPNQPAFPSAVLRPDERFAATTTFRFSVE